VAFTDRSTGSPTSWSWNFGDGGTSTDTNPTHTYATAGVYTITLTVTNSFGTDTATKTNYIHAGMGPVADFDAAPQSGTLPLAVQFQDQSTGNPATWAWNFGDGAISTDRNPSHTYTKAGTYTVRLTVANAFGTSTKIRTDLITTGTAPTADFTSGARTGVVPLAVVFTDASKGRPTSWSWDFGDGSSSSIQSPVHTYTQAGTYSVTLTVRNAYGSDSETKAGLIIAGGKPMADFTANQRVGVAPFTVMFTDLSTGNPTSWKWNFGDGTISTEQNPVHVYEHEGAYDVTLTVSNSYGTDTEMKTGATAPVTTGTPPRVTPTQARTPTPSAAVTTAKATTGGTQETPMPGFEGALAVTGLVALAYLAKRR
jgi:PGF-CTERM protein